MVLEAKAGFDEFSFGGFAHAFAIRYGLFQQSSVLAQDVVDVAHEGGVIAVLSVVISITTGIVTKLFVSSAFDDALALKAFFGFFHAVNLPIIIRLQTVTSNYIR